MQLMRNLEDSLTHCPLYCLDILVRYRDDLYLLKLPERRYSCSEAALRISPIWVFKLDTDNLKL